MGTGVAAMIATIYQVTAIAMRMAVGHLHSFIGRNRHIHMPGPGEGAHAQHDCHQPVDGVRLSGELAHELTHCTNRLRKPVRVHKYRHGLAMN